MKCHIDITLYASVRVLIQYYALNGVHFDTGCTDRESA